MKNQSFHFGKVSKKFLAGFLAAVFLGSPLVKVQAAGLTTQATSSSGQTTTSTTLATSSQTSGNTTTTANTSTTGTNSTSAADTGTTPAATTTTAATQTVTTTVPATTTTTTAPTPVPTSAGGPVTITIVHANDIHGQVEEDSKNGYLGFPKYKTIIDQYRAANPNFLVMDMGDVLHGTNFATLSQGASVVDLMNDLGVNYMVPGNHDFNYGYTRLKELEKSMNFNLMAQNITEDASQTMPFPGTDLLTIGGVKIGVFAMATPETKFKSNPVNTEGLTFRDTIQAAQSAVDYLKANGAQAIVMMSHLGMDDTDPNTYTVLDHVSGIDLVLDGHSHTTLPNGQMHGNTLIASTGTKLQNVGVATLTIDPATGKVTTGAKLIPYAEASQVTPDAGIQAKIDAFNAQNAAVLNKVIGNTSTVLDGVRDNVRTQETNLADLLTDAMLKASGADVALTNGGGIRSSIDAGEITVGEVLTVLPFANLMTVIEVTGQDILDALKHGTDTYPGSKGAFPQVAGMSYNIVLGADGVATGVDQVMVGGQPIDPAKTYKLATNDFMAIGGDGYTMFEGKNQVALYGLLADILSDYISALSADGAFTYTTDGRITAAKAAEPTATTTTTETKETSAVQTTTPETTTPETTPVPATTPNQNTTPSTESPNNGKVAKTGQSTEAVALSMAFMAVAVVVIQKRKKMLNK